MKVSIFYKALLVGIGLSLLAFGIGISFLFAFELTGMKFLFNPHIMLRDLLTQKCVNKKKVTDFGYPRACRFRKHQMGCPALGIWVAFLKQPDALRGRAPKKNKKYIFLNYLIHL
jgi:hypothetical protein